MEITADILLARGFEQKQGDGGVYYVKGKVGVVHNSQWLPCNVDSGKPLSTGLYINTMEELAELAKEANVFI